MSNDCDPLKCRIILPNPTLIHDKNCAWMRSRQTIPNPCAEIKLGINKRFRTEPKCGDDVRVTGFGDPDTMTSWADMIGEVVTCVGDAVWNSKHGWMVEVKRPDGTHRYCSSVQLEPV